MVGLHWSRLNVAVLFTVLIFAAIYSNAVWFVILPWLSVSVPGVLNLAGLTLSAGLALYSYLCCVLVDAGRVPEEWSPDEESLNSTIQVKRTTGGARYCQKCDHYKPPRCHHCRVCKRCVLRMDHHCPWINNCIGHANYRAFLLFLGYVQAALLHNVILVVYHQRHIARVSAAHSTLTAAEQLATSPVMVFVEILDILVSLMLMLCLASLFGWHIHLIVQNKTTIEYHEGVTAKTKASKIGKHWRHPYDIDLGSNLKAIFGENFVGWLLPIPPSLDGDGLDYTTKLGG
ncbi:hypothetical protein BSKO_10067 [Bryopsis sp. KO-2023]|nr:hypothetical protein BSKO_10067 [Bryopsis sp. KO-2023]